MIRSSLAWTIFGLSAAMLGASALIPDENFPLRAILFLGMAVMLVAACGALIASRRPDNAVGWVLGAIGFSFTAGFFATQYAQRALNGAGSLPGGTTAAWFQSWLWTPVVALLPILILCFPTGGPPSRRWRPVIWGLGGLALVMVTDAATRPGFDTFPGVKNPLTSLGPLHGSIDPFITPVLLILSGLAIASVFVRFRRSRGIERQQMKWFVYAIGAAVLLTLTNPFLATFGGAGVVAGLSLLFVLPVIGFLLIPVAIAIAILRHQAFDIDRVISRTLSYTIVTAFLGGLFALIVVVPTATIGSSRTPGWLVAFATLAGFGLFRPALRRVRSAVDRRFNRSRYDAARTIDAFTSRLREEVDIDALGAELEAIVGQTMQPAHVRLWLRGTP